MINPQNRIAMKRLSADAAAGDTPGFRRAWSTAFWFGRDGLAETRPAGDGYEGHLLRLVGGAAVQGEPVYGTLDEVKAALLAAVAGSDVVECGPAAKR